MKTLYYIIYYINKQVGAFVVLLVIHPKCISFRILLL